MLRDWAAPDLSAGEERVASLYLWHCQSPESGHSAQKLVHVGKKTFFSLMGKKLENPRTNHVIFYFQNGSPKTFLDSNNTHPSPALENHVNQTVISKHCIFWLKNYLPSQHTHIIFLCTFFSPRLNTRSEAAEMTIQYLLHAWFTSLPGKRSSKNMLGAPTWTSGSWLFDATFIWPGHHWPAVAQNLPWETEKLLFIFSGRRKCHFRRICYMTSLQHPQLNVP